MFKIENLFDLKQTMAKDLFTNKTFPWEVLDEIGEFVLELGKKLPQAEYTEVKPQVWVANDAKIFPNVYFVGPTIIGHGTEVRPGAFIRGKVLVGDNCVVGNSTELKNVVLFNNVQVPHYNYVGDSVLGYKAHMGAGSVTSNVKSDKTLVVIKNSSEKMATNRKKVGAMLGDYVEIGCNSVLNPGTIVGRNTNVYPLSRVRGEVPENSIYKDKDNITLKHA